MQKNLVRNIFIWQNDRNRVGDIFNFMTFILPSCLFTQIKLREAQHAFNNHVECAHRMKTSRQTNLICIRTLMPSSTREIKAVPLTSLQLPSPDCQLAKSNSIITILSITSIRQTLWMEYKHTCVQQINNNETKLSEIMLLL